MLVKLFPDFISGIQTTASGKQNGIQSEMSVFVRLGAALVVGSRRGLTHVTGPP